jgi:hypothetical protein
LISFIYVRFIFNGIRKDIERKWVMLDSYLMVLEKILKGNECFE